MSNEEEQNQLAFDDEENQETSTTNTTTTTPQEKPDEKKQLMQDIFGDDSDEDDVKLEATEFVVPPPLFEEQMSIPTLPAPSNSCESFYFRIPKNVVNFKTTAFDKQQYEQQYEALQKDVQQGAFRNKGELLARKQNLAANNVIRWRTKPEANTSSLFDELEQDEKSAREKYDMIQSNARLVKWSDGSYQLFIGKEPYDLNVRDGSVDNTFLFARFEPYCVIFV